jgi:hypothetical protein
MGALGKKGDQDHQVAESKQPLVGLLTGSFRGAGDEAQVAAAREIVEVVHADARKTRHFRIGEDFLTRFDSDHGRPLSFSVTSRFPNLFQVTSSIGAQDLLEQ